MLLGLMLFIQRAINLFVRCVEAGAEIYIAEIAIGADSTSAA